MGSINRNSLPVFETSNIFPDDFFITEARPSMSSAFDNEFLSGTTPWSDEQWLSSDWVVISDFLVRIFLELSNPRYLVRKWIAWVFCIMPIEVADFVGCLEITSPTQVVLYRLFRSTVSLLWHYGLITNNWVSIDLFQAISHHFYLFNSPKI